MLIRRDDGGVLAIGQLSHSWVSGQLARAWGNARFGGVQPREDVALGAEQHDIGWALFDLEPRFNPQTGLPCSFLELTAGDHLRIWRDAPDHLLSQSLHAALVVSMHGSSLSELRLRLAPEEDAEELRAHIAQEQARQAQLRAKLGVSESDAERTRRLMWTWDGLSLALCNGWSPFTLKDVPTVDGVADLELRASDGSHAPGEPSLFTVDPWPFAGERVELRCEARRLQPAYEDEAAMRGDMAAAEVLRLTFALLPPSR